jgi:tetratricopeptide (TPR) repeat protein
MFSEGMRLHRAKRLGEAERLYRQILAIDPRHLGSLHLLGLIAAEMNRPDAAVDLIGRAIAIDGAVAPYHLHLGLALESLGRKDDAATSYRRAIALKPDYLEALNNLGLVLYDQGKPAEAADYYRQVIALNPNIPEAHHNLGRALRDLGLRSEAVEAYSKAIALRPDDLDTINNLGLVLREQGRMDEAIDWFKKIVAARPDYPEAYHNLGDSLRNQGRFVEAETAYEASIRLERDACLSFHGLSACRKFTAADRPLIARMETALTDPKYSENDRILTHFALGKIFDDLKDYANAIRHYDLGNALEHKNRPFDAAGFAATVDWLIAASPAAPARSPAASDSALPLLIVGMPRSGTTLVEQIFASHPEVAAGGELAFWLQRLNAVRIRKSPHLDPAAETRAVADYLALLTEFSPHAQRVTDKMPHNFLLLGDIHRLFPKARIVHCRRNPIDTALSLYFSRFIGSHEFAFSRRDIVFYYREYLRLMDHWRKILPKHNFMEIDYEELVVDQEAVSRRLVAFSGLDWDDACLNFHETDRPIVTASAWQARQPVYRSSAERWRHYEPWLGEFSELLPLTKGRR